MNKLLLIGRLTKDAESRYTPDGKPVLDINLAVDDGYGENKKTLWVRCSLWGERGEKLSQYLTKGGQIYIEGRLNHVDGNPRIWGDPAKASFEVFVTDLKLLASPKKQTAEEEDYAF